MAGSQKVCLALGKQTFTIIQDADISTRLTDSIKGACCELECTISFSLRLGRTWSCLGVSGMLDEQSRCCEIDSISVGVNTLK